MCAYLLCEYVGPLLWVFELPLQEIMRHCDGTDVHISLQSPRLYLINHVNKELVHNKISIHVR